MHSAPRDQDWRQAPGFQSQRIAVGGEGNGEQVTLRTLWGGRWKEVTMEVRHLLCDLIFCAEHNENSLSGTKSHTEDELENLCEKL